MIRRLKSAWFLVLLVIALGLGISQAPALEAVAASVPRWWLIGAIIFATALPIDFAASRRVQGVGLAVALAVALNAGAAPPLAWLAGLGISAPFAIGLVVAAASPCTLASAAVWTRRGLGNDAVAVLVTLVTNLGCFLVLPFWATTLLGTTVEIDFAPLVGKLFSCVVAPIVVAQGLRRIPALKQFASHQAKALSLFAQFGVLTMAFVGAVEAGQILHATERRVATSDWFLIVAAASAVHSVLLVIGWRISQMLGIARAEAVAVAISGSQKTLAVGVGIALEFGGLAIFPMIAYHLAQLLIDTLFVDRARRTCEVAAAEPSAAGEFRPGGDKA